MTTRLQHGNDLGLNPAFVKEILDAFNKKSIAVQTEISLKKSPHLEVI